MSACPLCGDEAPVLYLARGEECCAPCARVHAGWDDTEESARCQRENEIANAALPSEVAP